MQLLIALAIFSLCSFSNAAVNYYCDTSLADLYCNFVLPKNGGVPAYNYPGMAGYNASAGWVIGQNTVVSLTPQNYTVGNVNKWGVPTPAIFIIEDGILEIVNTGSDEVAFAADMYLCGNGMYRIIDSKWRLASQSQYQYLIWAAQNSTIYWKGLNFTTLASDVPYYVGGSIGAQWMRGNSKVIVEPGSNGYGLVSYRPNDSWELIGIDNSILDIDQMKVPAEFYVCSTASWTISNSRDFDFFFEGCPSVSLSFSTLPPLCDITGSGNSPACLTPAVPAINFHTGPPETSFSMNLTNVTMFSWAFSVFQDGDILVENAEPDTNLFFGINLMPVCADDNCNQIIKNSWNITASSSGITGIAPYYNINTVNTSVTGYHLWMAYDNLTLTVNAGSVIGDLAVTSGSTAWVYSSLLQLGTLYAISGSTTFLYDSTISESVSIQPNGWLVAERCSFLQSISIIGTISIADTDFKEAFVDIQSTGIAHRVLLTEPALGNSLSMYNNETLDVYGGVFAVTFGFAIENPFPTAYLLMYPSSGGAAVLSTEINSPTATNSSLLASWNFTGISAGNYNIILSFGPDDAVATRYLTLLDWTGASPSSQPTASTSPEADSSDSRPPAVLLVLACMSILYWIQ